MIFDSALAIRLLPDLPGWTSPEAAWGSWGEQGSLLRRVYTKGHAEAAVELTGGPWAAVIVAQQVDFALNGEARPGGSRSWMLRGRRAHLVATGRGGVHSLGIVLRGGAGDLDGSVRLSINGRHLRAVDAEAVALAFDWEAIVTALGSPPPDPVRIAAALRPPPELPAGAMPALWPMMPTVASMEQMERLRRRRPPRFAIANETVIREAIYPAAVGVPGPDLTNQDAARFAVMPTPLLVIMDRGFAPDYIWAGLHFASARLRDALGLGPDVIEYHEVDASGSAVAARAADYRVFRVVHEADPVDLVRMYGH